MIQNTSRAQQLREQIQQLEQKLVEMSNEMKKRKMKQPQNADRQQRMKILQSYIDQFRMIQDTIQYYSIEEEQWNEFMQLLETLYQNLDNPAHESQMKLMIQELKNCKSGAIEKYNFPIYKQLEPFDPALATQQAQLIDQNNVVYKLKMMELSYNERPQGSDHYPPPIFKEKLNVHSLLPKYKMLPHTILTKLSADTLFYIFYYHKQSTEQQLAARELKKSKWMFNMKHGIWMKKEKSNYEENEKYLKGPFLYFDYEQRWQQKRKPDFKFKKKYLEED